LEREELRRRLEAWAEEERFYAERLAESAAKARSPLVRAVLTAVAMDSRKHHALLLEAVRLLEGPFVPTPSFHSFFTVNRGRA
jgi:hypothetical protein